MYGDAPLTTDAIVEVLTGTWDIDTAHVTYERVGYGSWHWLATDTTDTRWFITADDPNGPFPVRLTYPLAHQLEATGLEFVRGPRQRPDGAVIADMDGCLVTVWPWLDGRATEYGRHANPVDLEATTACLAELHSHRAIEPVPGLVEDWTVSGRPDLEEILEGPLGEEGPYAAETAALLTAGRTAIRERLARYDELVGAAQRTAPQLVITHGEPHAGNVVHTRDGAKLIDWDTVKWAPIERDLWDLLSYPDWDRGYGSVKVNDDLVELYRLDWEISEVADFAVALLGATSESPDHQVAMRELRRYLG